MDAYQKALLAHIRETAPLAQGIQTPSISRAAGHPQLAWGPAHPGAALRPEQAFQVEKDAEITVEANPDSVDLRSAPPAEGGGQLPVWGCSPAAPGAGKSVHRPHTVRQVDEAVAAARKAKLEQRLSGSDLRPARPNHMDSWKATVEHALSLIPQQSVLLRTEGGGGHLLWPAGRRRGRSCPTTTSRPTCTSGPWPVGTGRLPQYEISICQAGL